MTFGRANSHSIPRHTCASLLINNDYSLKDVQDWLGHADITTTANIYGHISMDRKNKMSDGLSESIKIDGCLMDAR